MNNPRDDRCARALERVLEMMRKKGEPEAMEALRARFPVSASILEADICQLREEGLTETEAQLLTLIPNLARY
ncbi:MAG: hypothetical protein MJ099_05215, partial [Clostridia bacterium]|nr:hypothetical protein [Clostridia bacterium]